MKKMTKIGRVLMRLKAGYSISQREAIEDFSYYRLSDGIYRLKRWGYDIETVMVKLKNGERYARYSLSTEAHVQTLNQALDKAIAEVEGKSNE